MMPRFNLQWRTPPLPRFSRTAIATLLLCTFAAVADAPLDLRVALVIGNAAYPGAAALTNPGNDAKAMAATLRKLGFQVIELRDSNRAQMQDAIVHAGNSLRGKQGIGMLYYAGHAMQLDWHNYMVPVDARLNQPSDVGTQTVDVDAVIQTFKSAGNRMNILVLDACRDNPFRGSASGKGLAQLDAPPGTFLAFATAPGNVAEDGDEQSGNGLYTQYLLRELQQPVAKIEDVFKRVRFNVRKKSNGRQIPWETTSLEEDFYFDSGKITPSPPLTTKMRDSLFSEEKRDWDKIKDSSTADDFYAYLLKYPNGLISQQAAGALERLAQAKVSTQKDKNGIVQNSGPRFRLGDRSSYIVKDGYTGLEKSRINGVLVTKISGGIVEFNGGVQLRTIDGGLIHNPYVLNVDPPRLDYPAGDFVVGTKWSSRSIETLRNGLKVTRDEDFKIVALEDVTVPAGTFKAFKFESSGFNSNGVRLKFTYWAMPGWGTAIRTIRFVQQRNGVVDHEIIELASFERGEG